MKRIIILVLLPTLIVAQGAGTHLSARYVANEDPRSGTHLTDSFQPCSALENIAILPPPILEDGPQESPEPEESDSLLVVTLARAAAEQEVGKLRWFAVGCVVSLGGFAIATLTTSPPPESHLIGKSQEYAEIYIDAYRGRSRSIQMTYAGWGCAASTGTCCVASFFVMVSWTESLAEAMGEIFWEAFFGSFTDG